MYSQIVQILVSSGECSELEFDVLIESFTF